jgi:replication factor C subunit 1
VPAVMPAAPKAPRKSAAASQAAELSPQAKAAVAAVDEAASSLPPVEELDVGVIPAGTEMAGGNDNTPPPNHGQKEAPRGHPDCLTGARPLPPDA